jgi:hypothetical protein
MASKDEQETNMPQNPKKKEKTFSKKHKQVERAEDSNVNCLLEWKYEELRQPGKICV